MAYEKTIWKARKGINLKRFEKQQETQGSVILNNTPSVVNEEGTPFSEKNMNKIEQGIYDAHELIDQEEQARIQGDAEALVAAKNYADQNKAPINAALTAETGSGVDMDTPAVASEPVTSLVQRIWGKIRNVRNVATSILSKIPTQASDTNQLADRDFVNSTIEHMAARHVTASAQGDIVWASLNALRTGPWFYQGQNYTPTEYDYAVILESDGSEWRASFDGVQWNKQYKINNSPFTAAQWAAINSQITSTLVSLFSDHLEDSENPHEVTKEQTGLGNVTNDAQVKRSEMGAQNGVATLDNNSKVLLEQLPDGVGDNNTIITNTEPATVQDGDIVYVYQ